MLRNLLPALFALLLAACHHPSADPGAADAGPADAAAPVESGSASPIPAPVPDDPRDARREDPGPPLPAAEVTRGVLKRLADDKPVAVQETLLREHFGGKIPLPLETQAFALSGGGRAVLLEGPPKERKPFIFVFDAAGTVLWTKERPLAGIAPGIAEMVMVPNAKGEVMLSWFDPPSGIVAARKWNERGEIIVDYPMFHAETCEALSGLHWPGHGFLVAGAGRDGARVQLLDESGRLAWGDDGEPLPWPSRATAPLSIAVDGDDSVMIFQAGVAGQSKPGAPPDHVMAARYDGRGKALWPRPVVVATLARPLGERLAVAASPGTVRLPKLSVEITSAGSVVNLGKHP